MPRSAGGDTSRRRVGRHHQLRLDARDDRPGGGLLGRLDRSEPDLVFLLAELLPAADPAASWWFRQLAVSAAWSRLGLPGVQARSAACAPAVMAPFPGAAVRAGAPRCAIRGAAAVPGGPDTRGEQRGVRHC